VNERADEYLARLGLVREPPGPEALARLHVRHLQRVPFENLDIWRGVSIVLDEERLVAKVLRGRGGFCYELNCAFAWLLRALGYQVTLLAASVADDGGGFGAPFDHLALRVDPVT
jgi:N-hydroxyarylamine O-acetyltransferase